MNAQTQNNPVERVNAYLEEQASLDTLRFITCGSVDDGKSTLIGRMLFEAQLIFEDQVASLRSDSKKMGTQGGDIDFALLVDGLAAEREQGITIDVAYRFFSTDRRKFIVADTPGHEQYTRNMVTGASTADVAVILIDARQGVLTQTRRHSMICASLGIKNVVLAVNKMDLMDYSRGDLRRDRVRLPRLRGRAPVRDHHRDPGLGAQGRQRGRACLEHAVVQGAHVAGVPGDGRDTGAQDRAPAPVPGPVGQPTEPRLPRLLWDHRGRRARVGQEVRVLPSGETATVKDIVLFDENLDHAEAGQAVTITLDREVDASRGDVIVSGDSPCEVSDQFEVNLVWMDQEPGYLGRSYLLKMGATTVNAQVSDIKHRRDINSFEKLAASKLQLNDLSVVTLKTDRPVPYEVFSDCPAMGSFILIDRMSHQTVAAGMINHALRRATNVHRHKLDVDKESRRRLNGHTSKCLWFTGLSGRASRRSPTRSRRHSTSMGSGPTSWTVTTSGTG